MNSEPKPEGQGPEPAAPDPTIPTAPRIQRRDRRTKTERAFDLLIIERHYLKGKGLDAIVALFEQERGYRLGRTQIYHEILRLRKLWEKEAVEMMSAAKAETLRSLRRQEEELWEAWDRSKQDAVRQTLTKTAGAIEGEGGKAGSRSTQQAVKESSCGDPAYMRLILDIHRERARIMGFEAPQKVEMSGPEGGPIVTATAALDDEESEAILTRHFERMQAKKKKSEEARTGDDAAQTPAPA